MAEVLVLAELNPAGGGVRKTTLVALTAARALGEPSAVVIGAPGTAAGIKDANALKPLVDKAKASGDPMTFASFEGPMPPGK